MNYSYNDTWMARMIAEDRFAHYDRSIFSLEWHPIKRLGAFAKATVRSFMSLMSGPELAPVFCTEYSPEC
jgi:hypothetical protein